MKKRNRRIFDIKKFLMINKLTILLIIFVCVAIFIPITYSILKTDTSSNYKLDTAFYILKSDYYEKNIKLDEIYPSDNPFVYNFSISNFDGENRLETLMDYDLKIITTTNLPLSYELYLNQNYDDEGANNIIINDYISGDEDGTYFRYLETNTVRFNFNNDITNNYQLVVKFPKTYEGFEYQDILEYVGIVVESKQVLE